eukprot:367600-Rhodomonas_salina.1
MLRRTAQPSPLHPAPVLPSPQNPSGHEHTPLPSTTMQKALSCAAPPHVNARPHWHAAVHPVTLTPAQQGAHSPRHRLPASTPHHQPPARTAKHQPRRQPRRSTHTACCSREAGCHMAGQRHFFRTDVRPERVAWHVVPHSLGRPHAVLAVGGPVLEVEAKVVVGAPGEPSVEVARQVQGRAVEVVELAVGDARREPHVRQRAGRRGAHDRREQRVVRLAPDLDHRAPAVLAAFARVFERRLRRLELPARPVHSPHLAVEARRVEVAGDTPAPWVYAHACALVLCSAASEPFVSNSELGGLPRRAAASSKDPCRYPASQHDVQSVHELVACGSELSGSSRHVPTGHTVQSAPPCPAVHVYLHADLAVVGVVSYGYAHRAPAGFCAALALDAATSMSQAPHSTLPAAALNSPAAHSAHAGSPALEKANPAPHDLVQPRAVVAGAANQS